MDIHLLHRPNEGTAFDEVKPGWGFVGHVLTFGLSNQTFQACPRVVAVGAWPNMHVLGDRLYALCRPAVGVCGPGLSIGVCGFARRAGMKPFI